MSKLEKMKAEQNLIYSLVNSEGQLVNSTEEVLKVTYDFYKNLYSKEPEDNDAQRELLDGVDNSVMKIGKSWTLTFQKRNLRVL